MRPRKHGVGWSNINLRGLTQIFFLCGLIQNSLEIKKCGLTPITLRGLLQNSLEIKRMRDGPKTLCGLSLTKLDWAKINAIEKQWAEKI